MKVKIMTNAKKQKMIDATNKKIHDVNVAIEKNKINNAATHVETTAVEKIMTIADVARELNIDPKRARAFLRKNPTLYTMRKMKFTSATQLYRDAVAALTAYKTKNTVVTE